MIAIGLDHSLTGFGIVAVPEAWEPGRWDTIHRVTLATKPGPLVQRRAALARDAIEWIRWVAARERAPLTSLGIWIEGGVFSKGKAETIRSQERLAGVVEHEFMRELGREVQLAHEADVRTVFAGPSIAHSRGRKEVCQGLMRKLVGPAWDEAELDALLVANWGLAATGLAFVSVAPPLHQTAPRPSVPKGEAKRRASA